MCAVTCRLHLKGAGVKPDEAVELARLSKIVGNFKSHWKSLLVTGGKINCLLVVIEEHSSPETRNRRCREFNRY
jgi:hypothetical protein